MKSTEQKADEAANTPVKTPAEATTPKGRGRKKAAEADVAEKKAEVKKLPGLRGMKRHGKNPFLDDFVIETRGKLVKLRPSGHYIDEKTGEITSHADVYTRHFVDKEQHIKIFTKGIAARLDLSRTAVKAFSLVLKATQRQAIGGDMIFLHFMDAVEDPDQPMSKPSFYKGLAELIDRQFLAPATAQNAYYINPSLFFNGDRFRFIDEYVSIKPKPDKKLEDGTKKSAKDSTKDMFEEFK